MPQSPAAVAEITGAADSSFSFCRNQIPMALQSMTQSAQSAVNMANITPWAHELRDTEADTMEEPSRDKLNKVGQVATPTHDTLGLGSIDLGGPGKWFNWSVLGHSDAMAVRAETKPKIAFYGTIAAGVQTPPMSTEVNGGSTSEVCDLSQPHWGARCR